MIEKTILNNITFILGDCMEFLKKEPPFSYDLAIVDPPYGIGISSNPVRQKHNKKSWDNSIPDKAYFEALKLVAIDSIIWGANYFSHFLGPSQGFIVWDKVQPEKFSLAMCEFAYTSIQKLAKLFRYSVQRERNKIHCTQKPVKLYEFLLLNYAKAGDRILDTHGGSGSIAIACHNLGYELTIIEKDPEYYRAMIKRYKENTAQLKLSL